MPKIGHTYYSVHKVFSYTADRVILSFVTKYIDFTILQTAFIQVPYLAKTNFFEGLYRYSASILTACSSADEEPVTSPITTVNFFYSEE